MKKIKFLFFLFLLPLASLAQWTVNEHLYSQSMTATCAVYDALASAIVNNANLQVVAMNGNTCCGAEMPMTLTIGGQQQNVYFLTIYGETNDQFQICVWDINQEKFIYKSPVIPFVMNNTMGTPTSPYPLSDGYSVCFDANGGTGMMPCQKFVYDESQNLPHNTFTAPNRIFQGWSTSQNGTVQYADDAAFSTHQDVTLYARWRTNTLTISASAGENGTISPSGNTSVEFGGSANYVFIPNANYAVDSVFIDGVYNPSAAAAGNYTFNNVSTDHTIRATFKLNGCYITALPSAGGHITPEGDSFVVTGQSITYNIVPDNNYSVVDVLVDGISVGAVSSYTFYNVMQAHTISASFEFMWNVTPSDYEQNMNVFAMLQIDGTPQTDTNDIVAVFDGAVCVGLGRPMYIPQLDRYLLFLSVFGNADQTPLDFKVYDASEEYVFEHVFLYDNNNASMHLTFQGGAFFGSVQNPIIINAKSFVEQEIHTVSGWNWISTNVYSSDEPLLEQFVTSVGNNGIQLKSQTDGYYQFFGDDWFGNLPSVENEQGYMLNNSAPVDLTFVGILVEPSDVPITLSPGWTWIGYTPDVPQSPANAFSNFEPQDLDIIKGQNNFSQYVAGLGWLGSLNAMSPGNGYMYWSNSSAAITFTYANTRGIVEQVENVNPAYWQSHPELYPTNMTLTVSATIDGQNVMSEDYEIAAFCGDECRGTCKLVYEPQLGRYVAYLTVNGNDNEPLVFKMYDEQNSTVLVSTNSLLCFSTDGILGNPAAPFVLNFVQVPNGLEEYETAQVAIYPNPAKDFVTITSNCPVSAVEIYNSIGSLVFSQGNCADQRLNISQLVPGVYLMKIHLNDKVVKYQKLVVE